MTNDFEKLVRANFRFGRMYRCMKQPKYINIQQRKEIYYVNL